MYVHMSACMHCVYSNISVFMHFAKHFKIDLLTTKCVCICMYICAYTVLYTLCNAKIKIWKENRGKM